MAYPRDPMHLRLYIAGHAPNSARAQLNLTEVLRGISPDALRLEIVDVLQEPLRALNDKVFVTPLLWKLSPQPETQIVGDLHDVERVRLLLGLEGGPHEQPA